MKKNYSFFRILVLGVILFFTGISCTLGQVYHNMATSNFSDNFTGLTSGSSPSGSWKAVPNVSSGSIPSATNVTVGWTTFASSTTFSGSVGVDGSRILFLSTGTNDNTTSIAFDLNLNFSNRKAGTLTFDVSTVFNSNGNRVSSLRIFYSLDSTNWTQLTGTNIPYSATNNVTNSATGSITLPSAMDNQSRVKIRFYYHNGSGGNSGSRPKISVDNVLVNSSSMQLPIVTASNPTGTISATYGSFSNSRSSSISASNLTNDITATATSNFEVSNNNSTFGNTAILSNSSGSFSGTLYFRTKSSAPAGNYNSAVVCSLTTPNLANPVLVSTTGSGNTVSTKNLTITGINANNKTYDKTTTATISGTPVLVGVVGSDVVSVTGTPTATFAQEFIGNNVGVTVTGYSLMGAASGNYSLTQPSLSANITAKNLNISGISIADKPLDGNTQATIVGTPSLVGVVSGDVVTLSGSPVAQFTSTSVGTNIPVNVSGYTLSGAASGNYSLSQPSGLTASIIDTAKQNQTLSFGTLSGMTYGDAPFNLTASASSGLSVSFSSSNASVATVAGNTVTIVGPGTTTITASQAGNTNYNAANPVNQTLNVAVKTLTVSGATAQNKTYDGNASATISGATLNGIVGSDNVTVSGGGSFASANSGTGIAVTANLTLGGTDASKYALTQPTGLTANITKATQTINFPAIAAKNSNDAPFTLSATTTSGLSVSFASLDTNILKISGTTATIASYGNVTIAATQLGNNNYDSAYTVYQSLSINRLASTIAAWEVSGLSNYGPSPFSPFVSDTNLTIIGLTRGSGFNTSGTAVAGTFGGTTISGSSSNSLATAISTNTFFFFAVTPKANRKVSFNRIDTLNIRRSSTAHTTMQWQYQINNNAFVNIGSAITIGSVTSSTGNPQRPIDLSGISNLQNIEEGTTVTFRLLAWGATGTGGNFYINNISTLADLVINGFVEPNFKPTLVVPNVTFSAFNQSSNGPTSTQTFTVNGRYLTSDVGIKAPAGFEVSDNATSNFSDSLTLPVNSGLVTNGPVTVYVRLNASNLGSYAGNINITSIGATSKIVAVNGVRSGIFYSKSSGNLQDLSTWGFNTDGTGNSPLNFTTGGATYVLTNRTSVVLDTLISISGTSSKMIIGDSVNPISLQITSNGGLTGTVDLNANATLILETTIQPTIGTQGANATLEYKNIAATLAAGNYKNLTLTGTGTKTFAGGTLNIAGNLVLDNVSFNGGNPAFTTLNVGGNVTYVGSVIPPVAANSITLNFTDTSGATKTIDAAGNDVRWFRISVPANATVDVQNANKVWVGNANGGGLNVANNGTLKFNTADLELFPSTSGTSFAFVFNTTGKIATTDSTDVYLARAANANLGTLRFDPVANSIGNFTMDLSGSTNKSVALGSNLKIAGNIQLNNGTLLVGTNELFLAGSSINNTNGKISVDSATVVFENTANLTLNRSIFAANVNHVRMNSTAEVALTSNLNIQGNLTLNQGILSVVDSQVTVFGSISGGNSTSYIKSTGAGVLKKSVANGITQNFPIGNSTYNPVQIKNNTGSGDEFSVRVLDEVYANGTSGTPSVKDRVKRTWDISKATANGGSGVDFTFTWNGSSEESGTVANPLLNHFNSTTGKWELPAVAASNFVSGTSVTFTGYTGSFSPFGIGNGSGLPVTWISVKGIQVDQHANITWATASEENNDFFVVERSLDGKSFESIGQVESKGSLGGQYAYSDLNASIQGATLYYRIKQVDYNGASTYSMVVAVTFNKIGVVIGNVYPNPVNDVLNVSVSAAKPEIATFSILDVTGKLIQKETKSIGKGSSTLQVSTQNLPQGIYFLQVVSNGFISLEKFTK